VPSLHAARVSHRPSLHDPGDGGTRRRGGALGHGGIGTAAGGWTM